MDQHAHSHGAHAHGGHVADDAVIDPVCGMTVDPHKTPHRHTHAGRTYSFCSACCRAKFAADPQRYLVGAHAWLDQTLSNRLQLALATPVVLWAGWPFFVRGWQSLRTRNLNMFTLIAMGTGVAYVYSLIGTVAPDIFPATFRGHGGAVPVYFEAAA